MPAELGRWLREQRETRGWSRTDMARKLVTAARAAGDNSIPDTDSMGHNLYRWERGLSDITERHKLNICRVLAIPASQFGPPPEAGAFLLSPVAALAPGPGVRPCDRVAYREIDGPETGHPSIEREVVMAAHEGSDHAEEHEQHGIGEATLEQLRADVVRLSGLSDTGFPLPVFLDMRRVRSRIYRLLDRRLWPRELTDLHFLLGCLNGLMGIAANRLGYPDAGEELIRAGYASALAIDHRPLQAQLRQQLSSVAYLRGRIRESDDLATGGLAYISAGPEAAHLYLNHARAVATLGDADTARAAISQAHEARDRSYSDDLLEIGGEFSVSLATHHALAGAALAGIKGAEREAGDELERSVSLYDQGPGPREQHWFGGKPLASIDLAVIRIRTGALEGAAAALDPAFSLPVDQRIADFAASLALVRAELAAPVFRGSAQARDLDERIEDFGRDSVAVGLHSLPGGPG